jgi:hypothetical protein
LPKAETLPLFQKAKQASPQRYQFAVDRHAILQTTPDGKSFYLLWLPEGSGPEAIPPLIVTLHGHGSWVFDEFFLWQPHLAKRGYGILALQWWFGQGERMNDYYLPRQIHEIMETALAQRHVPPRRALLHGFSRGSANIYGVTAFDRAAKQHYVLLTVANAGKPGRDFPVNMDIDDGRFGTQPFADTHWVLYAGAKDPHPDRDGIAGMREARDWIKRLGGTVDLLIEDPNGDHGGFHRNPDNLNAALDLFARLLADPSKRAADRTP